MSKLTIAKWVVAASALIWGGATTATAQTAPVYVSKAGNDINDGQSWETAKLTVQAGLSAATSGDQVWVAAGAYVERITLKAGVALYGGFAGDETDLAERDWLSNPTILDGNQGGSVVTSPANATQTTSIDGFTIRNGRAGSGGGIYCNSSSPTISNNTITGNTATSNYGGGIYCLFSSAVISDNTITGNSAYNSGGGIFCNAAAPAIHNNTITGNTAIWDHGGGIYCRSSATISNNTITNNRASSRGGGLYCYSSASSSSAISNNTVAANTAGYGGGICCESSSPSISNNAIAGNTATYGGGIYCLSSSPAISNNTVVCNTAGYGGGFNCDSSSPSIRNNIVAFNSSGLIKTGGTLTLGNNCVYNPAGANYSGLSAGTGDISADPQLLAADHGEFHLKTCSPCTDAGLDSVVQTGWVDMDGEPRIQGAHVDIGADEFNGSAHPYTLTIVRVSPSGNDANDGATWATSKLTVQAGISAAAEAGGGDVWVEADTYSQRITLKLWVHVYGGFAGTESSGEQRNWTANWTILDGGAGGSVVTASAPGYGSSTIDGFTIRNGSASSGGGIYCTSSSPTISNNTITGNTATGDSGGGIYCTSSCAAISENTITGNNARYSGGGIYCSSGSPVIANNRITENRATSGLGNSGGGVSCAGYYPIMCNNTIAGNTAGSGGGIYCSSGAPAISNNIVAFNSSALYKAGGTPTLRNNCVYDGYSGLSPGIGDISVDPLFVNRQAGDYRLAAGSPCIDAGYNTAVPVGILTDLTDHPRFLDDSNTPDCQWAPGNCGTAPLVDMGAHEFIPVIPGDFNRDGYVDNADLDIFAACFTGPGVLYDPTGVLADSVQDFSNVQGQYGWSYGYYDRTADPGGAYDYLTNFQLMTVYDANEPGPVGGPAGQWRLSLPPTQGLFWTALWADGGHPNATNTNATEHWPIRRWVSDHEVLANLAGNLAHLKPQYLGNGLRGRLFVDGQEVWTEHVNPTDSIGIDFSLGVSLYVGSRVDLAIDPEGHDTSDWARFQVVISAQPCPGCTLTPDSSGHTAADFDADGDEDLNDFSVFQRCSSGWSPANPGCAN